MNRTITISAVLWLAAAAAATAQSPPRWRAVEDLRIAEPESPPMTDVVSLTVDRAGRILAASRMDSRIHVFSPAGRHERSAGRRGQGPGEFMMLTRLAWKGDTLYAVDAQLQRLTLFTAQGQVARTLRLASPAYDQFPPAAATALLPDGSALAVPGLAAPYAATGAITRIPMLRLSPRGQVRGTFASLDVMDNAVGYFLNRGRPTYLIRPIHGQSLWAVSDDGAHVALVHQAVPRSEETVAFRVVGFGGTGEARFSREIRYAPRPLTRRIADSLVANLAEPLSRSAGMPRSTLERSVREGLALPRFQAPVTAVVAGRDGTVWLRRERLGTATATWMVLDGRGATIAIIELPSSLEVHAAQRDRVWGVHHDTDGVPVIVRYAVRPIG